jgi:plastocyanin
MKRIAAWSFVVCAALLALLVAPGATRAQAGTQTVDISLSEFVFSMPALTVTQGQTVHFNATNTGKFPHNIAFKMGDKTMMVFATPLKGGTTGSADVVFEEAGTWEMYCPVGNHAAQGMVGTVTVQAMMVPAPAPGMPSTGVGNSGLDGLLALAGVALLAGGLLVRRRPVAAR